jgi:hypothetical protein
MQELNKKYVIEQHVVLLGGGNPPDVWERGGGRVKYHVHKLREKDPDSLLTVPATAPFAVLGRAKPREREALLIRVLNTIWAFEYAEDRRRLLLEMATMLADIRLKSHQVERAWEESAVPFPISEATLFRKGENYGEVKGKIELLTAQLDVRFGEDPSNAEIAARLSELDCVEAARRLEKAESLESLCV